MFTTCVGVGFVFIAMLWIVFTPFIRYSGPTAQPTLQPVTLKALPALPMESVLSHIPSKVAK